MKGTRGRDKKAMRVAAGQEWDEEACHEYGKFEDIVLWRKIDLGYITVPKTANTSIKITISRALGVLTDEEEEQVRGNGQRIHQLLREKKEVAVDRARVMSGKGGFFFSVVRDPWERIISFHRDKILGTGWRDEVVARFEKAYGIKRGSTLEDTMEVIACVPDEYSEVHFKSQYGVLNWEGRYLPQATFRFENLPQMWEVLRSYAGAKGVVLPAELGTCNKSPTGSRKTELSGRAKDLIYRRYRKDIEFYGYEF